MARCMALPSTLSRSSFPLQQLGAAGIICRVQLSILQLGALGASSSTPYYCQRGVEVVGISKSLGFVAGGGDKGFAGCGHGRRGGSGNGFGLLSVGESSVRASGGESSASMTEDVIFLNVGGMSCGHCSASVRKILEAQPQVKEATVDLAAATAEVQVASESVAASGWESIKRELGESLAKNLTTCGFNSSLREQDGTDGKKIASST